MIGGGSGAFIGAVHRMAARLDGQIELVCGAFSSSLKRVKRPDKNYIYRKTVFMILGMI